MKKPIKNGKEVFAVLSMATVMSISMSVKVDAASEIDAAAESAATAVVQSENKNHAILLKYQGIRKENHFLLKILVQKAKMLKELMLQTLVKLQKKLQL